MTPGSPAAACPFRVRAIVLIAISLAAIAVHGKATRGVQVLMQEKEELVSVSERPKVQ
ncbi:MAG: hypothetical protein ACRCTI_08275 [Beijerinckiaceae bacterium]